MSTPRMLKVNSILREVLAEEVEKLSDTRLELIAITGVDTAPNLRKAVVYVPRWRPAMSRPTSTSPTSP
jgi:ribosome-binding factor A